MSKKDLVDIVDNDDDGPEESDRSGGVINRLVTAPAQSQPAATAITGDADRSVPSSPAMVDRTTIILIVLVAVGFILRLVALGIPELWYDEAFGRLITLLPFNRMIAATAGDVHPPLWYIIMWLWVRLVGHNSEFLFRLPSVFFSLAAIPVAWRLMKHLAISDPAKLVVAAWLALGPFELYFGQEGRMYSLLQLVFLVAVLAAIECRWWLLGISTVALLYTHNYGLFYVATLAGLMVLIYLTGPFKKMYPIIPGFISLAIAGLCYMPWLIFVLLGQMNTISSGYWIEPVTPGAVVYTLTIFLFGPFTRQFVLAATLVAVGLLVWSVLKLGRRSRSVELYWLAAAPAVIAILAGLVWRPLYLWRGLIGSAPFLLMIVIPPMVDLIGWRRWYVAAIVAPVFLAGFAGHWLDINAFKSTTLEAVHKIQAAWQPGDILYSSNDGNWVMFTTYFPAQPVYLMPQCTDHDRGALSDLTRKALGVEVAPIAQIDHGRAWFLWNWGAPTSWCNYAKAAGIVGDTPPWWLVESSKIMEAGIWLIK